MLQSAVQQLESTLLSPMDSDYHFIAQADADTSLARLDPLSNVTTQGSYNGLQL